MIGTPYDPIIPAYCAKCQGPGPTCEKHANSLSGLSVLSDSRLIAKTWMEKLNKSSLGIVTSARVHIHNPYVCTSPSRQCR